MYNIKSPTKINKIQYFPKYKINRKKTSDKVLFIGNSLVFNNILSKYNFMNIMKILSKKNKVIYYYPHPRDKEELSLLPKNFKKHIKDKTHFFWMSSLIFEEAIKSSPEIINAYHSSGLGQTFDFLNKKIKDKNKIQGYLSYDDWKKNINQ